MDLVKIQMQEMHRTKKARDVGTSVLPQVRYPSSKLHIHLSGHRTEFFWVLMEAQFGRHGNVIGIVCHP